MLTVGNERDRRSHATQRTVGTQLETSPIRVVSRAGRAIPDAYRAGRVLIEIKDVQYLYKTGQISAELAASETEGSTMYLLVSPGTKVAGSIFETDATVGVVDVTAGTVTEAVTGASLLDGLLEALGVAALF